MAMYDSEGKRTDEPARFEPYVPPPKKPTEPKETPSPSKPSGSIGSSSGSSSSTSTSKKTREIPIYDPKTGKKTGTRTVEYTPGVAIKPGSTAEEIRGGFTGTIKSTTPSGQRVARTYEKGETVLTRRGYVTKDGEERFTEAEIKQPTRPGKRLMGGEPSEQEIDISRTIRGTPGYVEQEVRGAGQYFMNRGLVGKSVFEPDEVDKRTELSAEEKRQQRQEELQERLKTASPETYKDLFAFATSAQRETLLEQPDLTLQESITPKLTKKEYEQLFPEGKVIIKKPNDITVKTDKGIKIIPGGLTNLPSGQTIKPDETPEQFIQPAAYGFTPEELARFGQEKRQQRIEQKAMSIQKGRSSLEKLEEAEAIYGFIPTPTEDTIIKKYITEPIKTKVLDTDFGKKYGNFIFTEDVVPESIKQETGGTGSRKTRVAASQRLSSYLQDALDFPEPVAVYVGDVGANPEINYALTLVGGQLASKFISKIGTGITNVATKTGVPQKIIDYSIKISQKPITKVTTTLTGYGAISFVQGKQQFPESEGWEQFRKGAIYTGLQSAQLGIGNILQERTAATIANKQYYNFISQQVSEGSKIASGSRMNYNIPSDIPPFQTSQVSQTYSPSLSGTKTVGDITYVSNKEALLPVINTAENAFRTISFGLNVVTKNALSTSLFYGGELPLERKYGQGELIINIPESGYIFPPDFTEVPKNIFPDELPVSDVYSYKGELPVSDEFGFVGETRLNYVPQTIEKTKEKESYGYPYKGDFGTVNPNVFVPGYSQKFGTGFNVRDRFGQRFKTGGQFVTGGEFVTPGEFEYSYPYEYQQGYGFDVGKPNIPIPTLPGFGVPFPKFPKVPQSYGGYKFSRPSKQSRTKYTPSFEALFLGKTAFEQPKSPIGLRPIIVKPTTKKKKKKKTFNDLLSPIPF